MTNDIKPCDSHTCLRTHEHKHWNETHPKTKNMHFRGICIKTQVTWILQKYPQEAFCKMKHQNYMIERPVNGEKYLFLNF